MPDKDRKRLDSWGEIAGYLKRDLTTVKRWEKEKGLPVYRVPGGKRQAVFAYQDEIDKWLSSKPTTESLTKEHKYFRTVGVLTIGLLIIVAAIGIALRASTQFSPRVLKQQRLTHDRLDKSTQLFTDGPHVYFGEFTRGKVSVALVPSAGGGVVHFPVPFRDFALLDVVSDGSGFFIAANPDTPNPTFWTVPLPGGPPKPIENLGGIQASWSSDAQYVAYVDDKQGNTLYVSNGDGTDPQQIFTMPNDRIHCPRWSPNGKVVRFTVISESQAPSLWEVSGDGADPHVVIASGSWHKWLCGSWTPDGKYYVFTGFRDGKFDLWAREERSWLVSGNREPVRLTNGPLEFLNPVPSVDGKRIFAFGIEHDAELVRYDAGSQTFVPYLGGISAGRLGFSRDGKWIAYIKHPERTLWRRRIDGGDEVQLTFAPLQADAPHWSPDGERIAFRASLPDEPYKIFIISRDGGIPEEILPADKAEEGIPTWSPDGHRLVFGGLRWHPDRIAIHIIDLRTKQVSTVPGSQGLWTPRWSPDGRYLLALTADALSSNSKSLFIFDFRNSRWRKLIDHLINEPVWSHDGKYIYFDVAIDPPRGTAVFRVAVSNGRLERVVSLENFHRASEILGDWLGLAPDDSPLLLRDRRNTEVYALDVKW